MPTSHRPIAVFSGGSAANSLSPIFMTLAASKSCPLAYIIPISDNGGSSSELIRVFGGPGIGDVRSRLVRLIPRLSKSSPGWREREGIRALFSHRLNSENTSEARSEWNEFVDGTSILWKEITSAKKELIRSIFNLVNLEIIKRSRPPSSTFDFTSASVGNLFLTGARLFTGSFESAIYLMSSICGINDEDVKVVPSINSNFSHHIAAGLGDGTVIVGQNAISHPSPLAEGRDGKVVAKMTGLLGGGSNFGGLAAYDERRASTEHYYGDEEGYLKEGEDEEEEEAVAEEDANMPGTLPTLRTKNITFNKNENQELPAKISRIWYINPYGQEILPPANPRAIAALSNAQSIIYSISSLYTSLVPSLILKGVGTAIRKASLTNGSRMRTKILILNGSLDREVGPPPKSGEQTFSALDFVEAIVRAGEQSRGVVWEGGRSPPTQSEVTDDARHLLSLPSPKRPQLKSIKSEPYVTTLAHRPTSHLLQPFPAPLPASSMPSRDPSPSPSPSQTASSNNLSATESATAPTIILSPKTTDLIYNSYITHLIHLPNSSSTPFVDRDLLLSKCGIQTVKVYGRKEEGPEGGMRYDPAALRGAIEAIIGPNPERDTNVSVGRSGHRNLKKQRTRDSQGKSDKLDINQDTEEDEDDDNDDDENSEGSDDEKNDERRRKGIKDEDEGDDLTTKRTREDERRRRKSRLAHNQHHHHVLGRNSARRNTVDSALM